MRECAGPDGTAEMRRRLRRVYDEQVDAREVRASPTYEVEQRDAFLELLLDANKTSLLELGAATGTDALFFRSRGLDVACVDLSVAMARRCRDKGLDACVMDAVRLAFRPGSFEAVYARNCLIHVPRRDFRTALAGIRTVLKPGGLCHIALYGGRNFEGVWEGDSAKPKRFFSFHTDERLRALLSASFTVRSFQRIPHGWGGLHYQAAVVEKDRRGPR